MRLILKPLKEGERYEKQVAYYKLHRKLFQYGEFFRIEPTGKTKQFGH